MNSDKKSELGTQKNYNYSHITFAFNFHVLMAKL